MLSQSFHRRLFVYRQRFRYHSSLLNSNAFLYPDKPPDNHTRYGMLIIYATTTRGKIPRTILGNSSVHDPKWSRLRSVTWDHVLPGQTPRHRQVTDAKIVQEGHAHHP